MTRRRRQNLGVEWIEGSTIHSYDESDGQDGAPAGYDDDEEDEEEHDRELEDEDEERDVYEDEEEEEVHEEEERNDGAVKVRGIEGNGARRSTEGWWKWVEGIMIMAMVLKEWCSGGGSGGSEEGK